MEKELQAYIVQFCNEMENKKKKVRKFTFLYLKKCKIEKFLMSLKAMCLRIQVAELNTLSIKQIT